MSGKPLISVIVPVFNVEQCLPDCISSLLKQTYKNLEIILVDDGSTDGSGALCDTFASGNKSLRVFHQSNQGLSGARNTGIRMAKGEFLCFVDSDDCVAVDYISFLYDLICRNQADIAIGGFITISSRQTADFKSSACQTEKLSCLKAVEEMLYCSKFSPSACGKLYRKTLFEGIWFPDRKVYEDLFTTYKLLMRSQTIMFSDKKIYCYKKYAGTLSTQKNLSRQLDCMEALKDIYDQVISKYPELLPAYVNCFLSFVMKLLSISNFCERRELIKYWKYVRLVRSRALCDRFALKRVRAFALLSYSGICFTKLILSMYYGMKWRF